MNQDFKDRLARLEARKTAEQPPRLPEPPGRRISPPMGSGGGKGPGVLKPVLLGLVVLIGLPLLAVGAMVLLNAPGTETAAVEAAR